MKGRTWYYNDPLVNPDDRIIQRLDAIVADISARRFRSARRRIRVLSTSTVSGTARLYSIWLSVYARHSFITEDREMTEEELAGLVSSLSQVWRRLTDSSDAALRSAFTAGGPAKLTTAQNVTVLSLLVAHAGKTVLDFRPQLLKTMRQRTIPALEDSLMAVETGYVVGDGQHMEQSALDALRADPGCGAAFLALAEVMRVRHRFLRASRFTRAAIRREPDSPGVPIIVARILVQWASVVNLTSVFVAVVVILTTPSAVVPRLLGSAAFTINLWLGLAIAVRMGWTAFARLAAARPRRHYWRAWVAIPIALGCSTALVVGSRTTADSRGIAYGVLSMVALTWLMDMPLYRRSGQRKARIARVKRDIDLAK